MNEMTQVLGIVAMEPKGEWDSETYYEKLNTVLYNDSTYMAKEGVVGENPSTSSKWQLIGGGVTKEYLDEEVDEKLEDFTIAFDTVALMKASTYLKAGMVVKTLGYYDANDGGAAIYKIKAKTNDDVADDKFIISLNDTTLIAELIYNKDINMKQVGAYGDGTHDETTLFQYIFNYAKLRNYQCNIIIPNGKYLITDSLTLDIEKVNLIGQNAEIQSNISDNSPLLILIGGDDAAPNRRIKNLLFKNINNSNLTNSIAMRIGTSQHCTWQHCYMQHW